MFINYNKYTTIMQDVNKGELYKGAWRSGGRAEGEQVYENSLYFLFTFL